MALANTCAVRHSHTHTNARVECLVYLCGSAHLRSVCGERSLGSCRAAAGEANGYDGHPSKGSRMLLPLVRFPLLTAHRVYCAGHFSLEVSLKP